jgi:hypothetical protein
MKSYHTLLSSLLLSLLLLSACNGSDSNSASTSNKTGTTETKEAPVGAINEERTFANNVWNSQSPEIFVIDITDSNAYYSIEFTVAIDTAVYRYETVPFYTDIFTPDGAHRHLTPEFPTKQYGRWKGEMRDGYRIISKKLYEYFPFSKGGRQRIEVRQATSQFDLEGIHSFTLSIKKADLDFEKMRNS